MRPFGLGHVGVEQWVVFRRVTVRPPIHGDRGDIACGIESSRRQRASELIADVAFEGLEGGPEELFPSRSVLIMFGQPRFAGSADHVQEYRLIRGPGASI